jgi:flavin reductase (DIM6/NTAB) family NADH-FMN oxidoreductase RutF
MKTITSEELKKFDSRYRARLVNSLSGIKSANLIGTVDNNKRENLSIVSSCFHLGADPALMGVIFRPAVVERHTYENIISTKYFTINHVHQEIIESAHQTSARYPREVSEFDSTGLTAQYQKGFSAPFVKGCFIQIGLELKESIHLEVNKTELVIGEVKLINISEKILMPDGFLDLASVNSIGVTGLDCYHTFEKGNRFSYAKPDQSSHKLTDEGELEI